MLTHMPSFTRSLTHSLSLTLPPPLEGMYACNALSLSPSSSPSPLSSFLFHLLLPLSLSHHGWGRDRGGGGKERRGREREGERRGTRMEDFERRTKGGCTEGKGCTAYVCTVLYIYSSCGQRERERGEGEKGRRREGAEIILTHSLFPPSFLPPSLHLHTHTHTLCSISHLVDPASSHMLSSKAKPCMSKYKGFCPKLRTAHYNGRNLNGPIPFPSRITLGI